MASRAVPSDEIDEYLRLVPIRIKEGEVKCQKYTVVICVLSATRMRQAGEITPASAENSRTYQDDDTKYAAAFAIDLKLSTYNKAAAQAGGDGTKWLKVTLDNMHCIEQAVYYNDRGTSFLTWICSNSDCSTCQGSTNGCRKYSLRVATERGSSDGLPPHSDCKYGDMVELKLKLTDNFPLTVREFGISGRKGK